MFHILSHFLYILQAVQISQASPAWQDFIDYIDAIVLDGLKQATLTSLKTMLNNLVQANMAEVRIFLIVVKRLIGECERVVSASKIYSA